MPEQHHDADLARPFAGYESDLIYGVPKNKMLIFKLNTTSVRLTLNRISYITSKAD